MVLEQLIAQFRVDADDLIGPYLWSNEWVSGWLSEAQNEAAIRGRMIFEASNPLINEIPVLSGTASYLLHPSLYELELVRFRRTGEARSAKLQLVSREDLDAVRLDWRDESDAVIEFAIQDDTRITLVPRPLQDGLLMLEGYRLPLKALENDTDKPEIHPMHHRHLVQWALHRAFSRPDAESIDPQRSVQAYAEFERYFGARPDADMRRITRHDVPHTNKAFWV